MGAHFMYFFSVFWKDLSCQGKVFLTSLFFFLRLSILFWKRSFTLSWERFFLFSLLKLLQTSRLNQASFLVTIIAIFYLFSNSPRPPPPQPLNTFNNLKQV